MNRRNFVFSLGKGFIGSSIFFTGCTKLLDQSNPNNLTPETFWKTSDDAIASVSAVYNAFKNGQWGQWENYMVLLLYRGDDIGITHDVNEWWDVANFLIESTNATTNAMWHDAYEGIFRANQAIENIPNIKMDSALKNRLIGEAKFFRAYFNFILITNFLNVPIINQANSGSSTYDIPQATPAETWTQIEKDLQDAIPSLPASYDSANLGRVTKGAALGYLGMSYLYQKDWANAAKAFNQIITSNNYSLLANYADVFREDNEFNEETLLEIQYTAGTISGVDYSSPRNFEESPTQAGGWYECYPNQFLFNEMSKEKTISGAWDPRLIATIGWSSSPVLQYGETWNTLFGNSDILFWRKYSGAATGHVNVDYSGQNYRVLRYADILLMYAESLLMLGNVSDSIDYINMIRKRADLDDFPKSATKEQVMRELEHQRILELADEGKRWYDLLRWNGSLDGSMNIKQNLTQHGAIGAGNFDETKHKYFPIPIGEMQTNTKIKQNPGY